MTRLINVICVPGTFERTGGSVVTGMLANVVPHLDERFLPMQADYPAAYGIPMGEAASIQTGVTNVLTMIRNAPNPVVLIGYSQGAQVVRMILSELAAGLHPDLQVIGAALIADPWREPGVANGTPDLRTRLNGWGIAGSGGDVPENIWFCEIAYPGDMIPNADGDNLVRIFADWTAWMSVSDMIGWGNDILNKIRSNRFQRVVVNWRNPFSAIQQIRRSEETVRGYLTGTHTCYGVALVPGTNITYCQYLAEQMNANVF
jgi:hypothetical protein